MSEILETVMLIAFGASWPLNVIKSYKARTTQGKSLAFLCMILFGYVAGILSKLLNASFMSQLDKNWFVLVVYALNFIMVVADLAVYIRNRKLDKGIQG